ncbi:MAG: ATP-dependent helicase [Desulfovibrionaceae bacterium]|nr:ATP-dependent helicase [Desulfovibrionaceae bacterium]
MIDISLLNPSQLEAVTAPDGPILVIAGAGSGKTRTLVYRLAWLTEQGVRPDEILLLTFTNKAGREMRNRASDLLNMSIQRVRGGTFHSFAYSILRRFPPVWAKGRAVSVMDASDGVAVLQRCKERRNLGKGDRSFPKTQTLMSLISRSRNREEGTEETLREESPQLIEYAEALEDLAGDYRAYKQEHGLLDYDDLLFDLEDLLQRDQDAAETVRSGCRYLLVDEYQDTNRVQARLVRLIAGSGGNVMAVGDEAQSIYAFRGADVRNILEFERVFPGARRIRLDENYRSVPAVLDVANAVMSGASAGFGKKLYTRIRAEETNRKVRLIQPMTDRTQASLAADCIEKLLRCYAPCEIAVLFRSGYQSYSLEMELTGRGILFRKYGGLRFSESLHVKDILAYVRFIVNPFDAVSFERVASFSRGIGPRTAARLHASMLTMEWEDFLSRACEKHPDLKSDMLLIDRLRREDLTPGAVMDLLLDHFMPKLQLRYPDDWPKRQQGLNELAHIAASYADLEGFAADVSLELSEDREDQDESRRVVLSTVHSAKGLEWKAVLVMDLVEDRFPSRHAQIREDIFEEERRLMYVACTRAQNDLYLFAPQTLTGRYGFAEPARPSPFLEHLPEQSLEVWRETSKGHLNRSAQQTEFPAELHRRPQPPRQRPAAPSEIQISGADCCMHRIFGRGRILEKIGSDRCRVYFPQVGEKVILSEYLSLEK